MLVGLVGRAVHPPIDPNLGLLQVIYLRGNKPSQIAVFMLGEQLPNMLGGLGIILVSVIMVAIMAASMSTMTISMP